MHQVDPLRIMTAVLVALPVLGIFLWIALSVAGGRYFFLFLVAGVALAPVVIEVVFAGIQQRENRRWASGRKRGLQSEAGVVTRRIDPVGKVQLGSELWSARSVSGVAIPEGTEVVVRSRDGLQVVVEPSRDLLAV